MKTKKKLYWDPSGEEIYKSKLDSANRQVKKDIREYQKYPFEFWVDLGGVVLLFAIQILIASIIFIIALWLSWAQIDLLINSSEDFRWGQIFSINIYFSIFLFGISLMIISHPFFYLRKSFKYRKTLQRALIINSLCQENDWVYRISKKEQFFNFFSKRFKNLFKEKYIERLVGNQIWGKYKKNNFEIGDIDYKISFQSLFSWGKHFYKKKMFSEMLNILPSFVYDILIIVFIFILFMGVLLPDIMFLIIPIISIYLFGYGIFLLFTPFVVFLSKFRKKYSFFAIELPKKSYKHLILKPQRIFEKDLVGVESVKLSELFKIEGGEKLDDIKILSPKIQVGIEELLHIQKIHSILFQGDTVIFLFHQPFFKKLYTDFSDGMKISKEGEAKFFQKIETMMKIVKKF